MDETGSEPGREWGRSPEECQRILRERARALSAEPRSASDPGDSLLTVQFRLAGESYAVDSQFVREVLPLRDLTPIPCAPQFVLGIVNVRGQILSVIDIKKFFGMRERGITDLNKIVFLSNGRVEFGILADAVMGSRPVQIGSLEPPPPTLTGSGAEYVRGVTPDRLIVLDIAAIMADQRLIVNDTGDKARTARKGDSK